jgi:hypothetical protein
MGSPAGWPNNILIKIRDNQWKEAEGCVERFYVARVNQRIPEPLDAVDGDNTLRSWRKLLALARRLYEENKELKRRLGIK